MSEYNPEQNKFYKEVYNGKIINVILTDEDGLLDLVKAADEGTIYEPISEGEAQKIIRDRAETFDGEEDNLSLDVKVLLMNWCTKWDIRPTVKELEEYYKWLGED